MEAICAQLCSNEPSQQEEQTKPYSCEGTKANTENTETEKEADSQAVAAKVLNLRKLEGKYKSHRVNKEYHFMVFSQILSNQVKKMTPKENEEASTFGSRFHIWDLAENLEDAEKIKNLLLKDLDCPLDVIILKIHDWISFPVPLISANTTFENEKEDQIFKQYFQAQQNASKQIKKLAADNNVRLGWHPPCASED